MKIIDIHPLTYFIIFSILICGYFNYFFIISIILIIHDLGHIIFMKMFKIDIINITILPFGSIINSIYNYNLNSNKLLLISLGGIINQLILYIIFYLLFKINCLNEISYNIFLTYNKLIIIFNLLPIIPLDGSKILISIIEKILPYKLSLKISCYISLISIVLFIFTNNISFNIVIISYYLLFKTYEYYLSINYIYYKFLLERYMNNNNLTKIKNVININKIYKNRYNFINQIREREYLANLFDRKGFF